ncbi:MAG: class I SAM-dependent RNA methyltransferase [Candidatus Methylomirabilis sp.]|nr:class I SAM-dependent RNA methyltransferase [Deltaproteobacteria bacterium]
MAETVEITSLAYGGKGVGRIDGKVVFVPYTAPGDLAEVEVVSAKKGYSEGEITRIERPSPVRVKPVCPLYGECGGCNLQHMSYAAELEWKQRILEETLRRVGKLEVKSLNGDDVPAGPEAVRFEEPIASPREFNYRSRARFHINGKCAGFFAAGSHRVVDMDACPLLDPLINESFIDIKDVLKSVDAPGISSFELVLSERDSKTVAIFNAHEARPIPWARALAGVRHLKGYEVRAITDRGRKGKRVAIEDDITVSYTAGGVDFSACAGIFSQVNRLQNRNLVAKALEFAALSGKETVIDLFSGSGNLTLPLALKAKEAIGVEADREAAREGSGNAARNSIENARFHAEDSILWLKRNLNILERGRDPVLVLDPPRGGEPQIARSLSGARPGSILYISCSPPTLARDLSFLAGLGYMVSRAVLIDMFPRTYHVESIMVLRLAE